MDEITIEVSGQTLSASRRDGPLELVMLHAGVADRRSWTGLMRKLDRGALAYDRPGFGASPPAAAPFVNVEMLDAVLDQVSEGPVTLVGNSQGGLVAVDAALAFPERIRRLVLIAPAVSGAPDLDWDVEIGAALVERIEASEEAGDLNEVNRLEALVWLDGPAGPEGRVGGSTRDLFLDMNRIALQNEAAPGPIDPRPAWPRLEELEMPVLVIVGGLDLPGVISRCRELARRAPDGAFVELPRVAHLPQLERPDHVAAAIRSAMPDCAN